MFIPLESQPASALRPARSEIAPSDWTILADYWYPIAIARDLTTAPLSAQLLDVPLALYRGTGGEIAIVLDICPHRYVRLSAGRVVDGQIECPFHGLRFDTSGNCRSVPALGRETKLPKSYRVRSFPVRERYGLVWTCVGDPQRHSVPEFPFLSDTAPEDFAYTEPAIWPVSAPRQVENFVDLAHLPFVHAATIGGNPAAPVKPGRIEHGEHDLTLHAHFMETSPDGTPMPCDLVYRIVLPFAVEFRTQAVDYPDHYFESCDIPSPVSAHRCKVFQIVKSPKGRAAAQEMVAPLTRINNEDIAMLGNTMTADLPLDQHHEIHLPVDNIGNAFRQRLRALGLGAGDLPAVA